MSKKTIEIEEVEYKPSLYFIQSNIAGFAFYEGAKVFKKLEVGTPLIIKHEKNNPYDANAVVLYYKNHKLGFLSKGSNREVSKIMQAGYNIFECTIQQIDPQEHPNQQVQVVIHLKEKNSVKKKTLSV